MLDIAKLRQDYAAKIAEAKALASGEMSAETSQKINALLGHADEIKSQIVLAGRLADSDAYANQPMPQTAFGGFREAGPNEGDPDVDVKAWRSFKISTPFGEREYRYHVPLAVQKRGYDAAFEAYIRHGKDAVGPQDRKALSEATDSAGGYLVPADYQENLIKKLATMATVRQYARVIQTSRDIVPWPRIKYTTNNEYTSGVRLTWTGETPSSATVHRVTDQVYGLFSIPINTAMASQLVSMDLIEDAAFDVLGISSELMAEAFALGEDAAFWTGSGAGQPRGIITDASDTANFDAAITTVATADTIAEGEIIDVCYGLPAQYERLARWYWTKATEKVVRKLADTNGQYLWPVINQVGGYGPAGPELLGFPVTRDEFVNDISDATTTTTYPVVFGDLTGYIIADRVGLSLQRNDSLYSETNNVLLLARKRVGGQLAEAYKLSLLKSVHST
jgi:HK97 family phage major capsid protein